MKLEDHQLTPAWRKLAGASTRKLVRAEARNLVSLRTAARAVHLQLLGHLAMHPTRAGALQALKPSRAHMAGVVAAEVVKARYRARQAALEQVAQELGQLASELRAKGFTAGLDFPKPAKGDPEADEAHADAVGNALAAQWAHAVLAYLVIVDSDKPPDIGTKASAVMQHLDRSLARIAATETARAFNAQHNDAIEEALRSHR